MCVNVQVIAFSHGIMLGNRAVIRDISRAICGILRGTRGIRIFRRCKLLIQTGQMLSDVCRRSRTSE